MNVHRKGLLPFTAAQHATLAGKSLQQRNGSAPVQVAEGLPHAPAHRHDRFHAIAGLADIGYVEPLNKIHGADLSREFLSQEPKECWLKGQKVLTLTPPYKEPYLRTIGNQLSTMPNHEVRHYTLLSNPMGKMNRIGDKKTEGMHF